MQALVAPWALAALVACAELARAPALLGPDPAEDLSPRIAAALAEGGAPGLAEPLREPEALARFYAGRGHRPAWLGDDGSVGAEARSLRASVAASARHGLRPDAYHAGAIARRLGDPADPPGSAVALELLLSDAFLHLARHLASGAVDPWSVHPGYRRAGEPPPDPADALAAALAEGDVAQALARRAPPHPEYAALVRALADLRRAASAGDRAAAARAERVRANLERWRWLPRDLGPRHLRVNTAAFTVEAFEAGAPVLAMRAVVGEVGWKTPLLHGAVSHIVLNPAWEVPRSIATREMLPAAQRDPAYFATAGIQVLAHADGAFVEVDSAAVDWSAVSAESFAYRLRQPPGPHNPMGRIKFMFPNRYAVYVHGTPADAAFERALRTLSHGCVRVEDEIALAAFALAPDPAWSRERLTEALRSASERDVTLPEPLPVHLLYFTASAAADGTLGLRDDVYGWDRALIDALDGRPPAPAFAYAPGRCPPSPAACAR